ncbi:MAG: type 1 glutamine amidotransferase [Anaerolineaceae bacterium]|nr:type 1 glutamine amidotransferase [Anaerolineaceae bacterium]
MTLEGKKILYLIGPGFEELEFYVPLMRFQEEGAQVVIAGEKAGKAFFGKHGPCMEGKADISFAEVNPADYNAVIIPGGWAPDKIRRDDNVKKLVRDMYNAGKIVGMICHAGLVGISAGIVKGHTATGSTGIKDDLINAGATWRDEAAFRSGNIVWGRVVPDIPYFCRELIKALKE